ncbi:MAG: hypothetical protein JOZ41_13955 [Chloroflexi bacterium]|nr:hypothetical protein [Chloroflexota bacterium]
MVDMTMLKETITRTYPQATFAISRLEGEDEGIYLTATVDVDDADAVLDLVIDRLLQLQIEEGLPIYVVPIRPLARVLADMESTRRGRAQALPHAAL